MMLHRGRKCLVVGSTGPSIGFEAAKQLIEDGATVVFHSEKSVGDVPEVAPFLEQGHFYVQADLFDPANAGPMIDEAWDCGRLGLDSVIYNAGTYSEPHFLKLKPVSLARTFNLNVMSAIFAVQHWATLLESNGQQGVCLVTSSINAILSEPEHVAYDSSKAALEGFVRSAAIDLRHLLRINALALGLVETPLTQSALADPEVRGKLNRLIPLGITKPAELRHWFSFAASEQSYPATGGVFRVDGGLIAAQATVGAAV
ncbi:MAG: SDR family oxidoreductase [Bdellovibrionota bacterium]